MPLPINNNIISRNTCYGNIKTQQRIQGLKFSRGMYGSRSISV